jgi:Glycosyl hydrolase family 63 C-terminal domain
LLAEEQRLLDTRARRANWRRWGPYLSERAWGTVREDYSANGNAWEYFPFEHAHQRAFRWNEDGIAGICDRHQLICFAVTLWNERDPILKERLFGLGGPEGNHGEDVKEYYFYLDNTPTHSYMRFLYKYPQAAFPYEQLRTENRRRDRTQPEYELVDTGVFADDRYFDVQVEYAKAGIEDVLIRITVFNRGPEPAPLHLLPTVWFRNTWSWGRIPARPRMHGLKANAIGMHDFAYGQRWLHYQGTPRLLCIENETNHQALFGNPNASSTTKDGFHDFVIHGVASAVNAEPVGSKAALYTKHLIPPGGSVTVRFRLNEQRPETGSAFVDFEEIFGLRQREADEYYATIIPAHISSDAKQVMRQAFAGLLWSKQYYHYIVKDWLEGDPAYATPPAQRWHGRNAHWEHLFNADVVSMPDKWEYPWYASWDLAFHCVPLALIDPEYAKEQIVLFLREWYMHPNGQLPAYEWSFRDVNPPVHAWAALRVYKIEEKRCGTGDVLFLERVFHKLLLNFTWWVNRKDAENNNIFQGGFMGLDNIGVFDRSAPLPTGGYLEQSDATSWMAMYTLNLLAIAKELAIVQPSYEDVASKFWEHFIYIAHAMNHMGRENLSLWDEEDGFYYDVLRLPNGERHPLRVRSMVGLIPLFAVETVEPGALDSMPGFKRRMQWFLDNRADLTVNMEGMRTPGQNRRRLLALVDREQLSRILKRLLDENEFLSPYGIRSLSRFHHEHPYLLPVNGSVHRVDYEPAESRTPTFGGNSNWRGPIWFPVNFLIIEALQKFHHYYGDNLKVECPTGSGQMMNLWQVAQELSRRLERLFLRGPDERRPINGGRAKFDRDPHWRDHLLFYEYFDGDTGVGLGASHQTGWTALVAKLLQQTN